MGAGTLGAAAWAAVGGLEERATAPFAANFTALAGFEGETRALLTT